MIINKEKKHLHIHVPKTGGESLGLMLARHGWETRTGREYGFGRHTGLTQISKNKDALYELSSFYKTTCIRNPWEHAVSLYRGALSKPSFFHENCFAQENYEWGKILTDKEISDLDLSFNRFMRNRYKQRIQSIYTAEDELMFFDEWFNYDEYDKMIKSLEKRFGVTLTEKYRIHDKRKLDYVIDMDVNRPYQDFYDEETFNIVEQLSLNEIKRFNYKF